MEKMNMEDGEVMVKDGSSGGSTSESNGEGKGKLG